MLIKRLFNAAPGFMQACVVGSSPNVSAATQRDALFKNWRKQLLRIPFAAGMEKVLGAPTVVLPAIGPYNARQGAPAQTDKRPE